MLDLIVPVLLILVIVFVLTSMVKFVPQGHIYTKTRFGKFTGELTPGLNFLTPIIEKIDKRINVMESVLDIPTQTAITRDNAQVSVDGVVFYQILEADKAAYAVSELGRAMENLTMTNIRTVIGNMNLDELLSQREKINSQLLNVIDEATTPWGVKVTRVEIKDIDPPRDLVDAMARQMKAERDKRAEILNAEGKRQSEILEAEGQKQAQILNAEGEREAAFREAEARERLAEAEANATETVSRAIAAGEMSAINYFIAQDYIKALQIIGSADNQKIIMLPLEATNLLGSIAGIGEMAKEVFGKDET